MSIDPTSHEFQPCFRGYHPDVCHAVTPDGEYETVCGRLKEEHGVADEQQASVVSDLMGALKASLRKRGQR